MATTDTFASCCSSDFAAWYEQYSHPAFLELERTILGCDYGGTSWTTKDQADQVAAAVGLGPGQHLLEVGAGSGWPSLYLASQSGCRVTLLDLPAIALGQALERIYQDKLSDRAGAVLASGTQLPFEDARFDAIGHSDVLCCLPAKLDMLRECRRVTRAGGRMNFFVIAPAQGLSEADFAEAVEAGPPFVDMNEDYAAMLRQSGWQLLERESLSRQYQTSLEQTVAEMERGRESFIEAMGEEAFIDEVGKRSRQAEAVANGILVRERYLAQTA